MPEVIYQFPTRNLIDTLYYYWINEMNFWMVLGNYFRLRLILKINVKDRNNACIYYAVVYTVFHLPKVSNKIKTLLDSSKKPKPFTLGQNARNSWSQFL